jgi:WD40 repeat protein
MVICPEGKLIVNFYENAVQIWDLTTSTRVQELPVIPIPGPLAISTSIKRLFLSCIDMIRIWDLETLTEITPLIELYRDCNLPLVISNDGRHCIAGSFHNSINIWDLETSTCIATLKGDKRGSIRCLVISNDGRRLISDSYHGLIKIWDLETFTCIATLKGHTDRVESLVMFDDCRLISGSYDGEIKIWDLETFTCTETLGGHEGRIESLAISDDGKLIAGSNSMIKIFDFTASSVEIFKEIAELFNSDDPKKIQEALRRFSKMLEAERNEIYGKLYPILKPRLTNDYWGCAEHAFHGQHGQKATCWEKAQAITEYVQEQEQKQKDK